MIVDSLNGMGKPAIGRSRRWQLFGGVDLLIQRWEDETVVYDAASGGLHLLGPVAAGILQQLQGGMKEIDSLAAAIPLTNSTSPDANFIVEIEELLLEMQALFLVENV